MKKTLTAALVGCGNISKIWLEAIQRIPELKIIGLVDIVKEKAEHRALEFNLSIDAETDLANLLSKTSPDIVFDCTTPNMRLEIVSAAFEFGCHVLVEKPLANTLENAKKIVALTREKNRVCAVIQNHRYNIGIRRLADFIHSGKLGEITQCNCNFYIGARFNDYRDKMKHVLLQDMAIHAFDAARFILDADPISVYCKEWNPTGSWFEHDASAVAIFQLTKRIVFTYQGSWCSQGLRTPWESQWRINGTKGSLVWHGKEDFRAQILSCSEWGGTELLDAQIPELNISSESEGHEGVIRDFIKSISKSKNPETICHDNIKSIQMVFGAIESAACDKVITIF